VQISIDQCEQPNINSESVVQFNSVYLYSPISQITNLSRSALQSVVILIKSAACLTLIFQLFLRLF